MASSLPDYIRLSQPFAVSGNKSTIPQTATGTNSASFQEGFPPITSQPLANGGMPPLRTDFNALGYVTTSTLAFLQQGGVFTFDTSISNLIGGYAQGAILNYTENGKVHKLISLINNNTYNFNDDSSYIGQYWDYVTDTSNGGGGRYIGEVFGSLSAQPPEGAYLLNGQTIYNCKTLYPDFWDWLTTKVSAGYVRSVTALEYEQDIAQYGFCGGFVISNNDVRLPTWKGYQTPLGNSVPVVGNGERVIFKSISSGAVGTLISSNSIGDTRLLGLGETGVGANEHVAFSENSGLIADLSNATDSLYWCIQVFNIATGLSTQESAQLASQIQMKAQTDLANVDNNIDFVVESYKDNAGNWYRKYRSGWVEQGGRTATNGQVVTFPTPFKEPDYTINMTVLGTDSAYEPPSCLNLTATGFTATRTVVTNNTPASWYACGYGA